MQIKDYETLINKLSKSFELLRDEVTNTVNFETCVQIATSLGYVEGVLRSWDEQQEEEINTLARSLEEDK